MSTDKDKQYQKDRRAKLELQGLCNVCGQCPPLENKKRCGECSEHARSRVAKNAPKRRTKIKEQGLCCCGSTPRQGKLTCERCNEKNKLHYQLRKSKGLCPHCSNPSPEGRTVCLDCVRIRQARYQRIKNEVFDAYGGYVCACCSETIKKFLTIDHINNDGKQHRQQVGKSRILYYWLHDNEFPLGFQVLCFNCNCGRQLNGGICPHKQLAGHQI